MWHPESPGVKVKVWRPWWRHKTRKTFATEHEMTVYYRRLMAPTVDVIEHNLMRDYLNEMIEKGLEPPTDAMGGRWR